MQNLPITSTPPAAQTQAPATPDNGAGPASEPFGSVLARQRANTREPAENGRAAAASAGGSPGSTGSPDSTGSNENADEAPALVPGATEDLLAAFYPLAGLADSAAATSEKPASPAHEANTDAALTSDTVAVPLPATTMVQQSATPPGAAAAIGSGIRPAEPAQFRAQDYSAAAFTDTSSGTLREDSFRAEPEMFGNETAHPALSHDSARVPAPLAQTDAAAAALPQTGSGPAASSAGGTTQLRVDTPLTRNSWGEEFSQKIIWMAAQRGQIAELHLNPPDLGPLDVVLSVSDGQATAMFSSPHAAVRNAVEQALPKLREMLADNGIMLGNATVSDQQPRERQAGLEDGRQNGGNWPARTSAILPASSTHGVNTAAWAGRRHDGMVDIFA
ncbi:MAG: flagellar hook-length control protein FliK [Nitrosomonadales bacterium]|nr:flagellar hook-length control protein FliK [Nitrosomonadales bacterium]